MSKYEILVDEVRSVYTDKGITSILGDLVSIVGNDLASSELRDNTKYMTHYCIYKAIHIAWLTSKSFLKKDFALTRGERNILDKFIETYSIAKLIYTLCEFMTSKDTASKEESFVCSLLVYAYDIIHSCEIHNITFPILPKK